MAKSEKQIQKFKGKTTFKREKRKKSKTYINRFK